MKTRSRGYIGRGRWQDLGWRVVREGMSGGNGGGCEVCYPQCDWKAKEAKSVVMGDVCVPRSLAR